MASYQCPRCSGPVARGHSSGAGAAAGLVGMLIYSAFGSFECAKCGKIPKSEFPPEVRSQMTRGSLVMVVVAVVLLVGVLALLVAMQEL